MNYPLIAKMKIMTVVNIVSLTSARVKEEERHVRHGANPNSSLLQLTLDYRCSRNALTGHAGLRTQTKLQCEQLCEHIPKCRALWQKSTERAGGACHLLKTDRRKERCNGQFKNSVAINDSSLVAYIDQQESTCGDINAVYNLEMPPAECYELSNHWYSGTAPKPAIRLIKSKFQGLRYPHVAIELPTNYYPTYKHCAHFCRNSLGCKHWNFIWGTTAAECHLVGETLENCTNCKRRCGSKACWNGTN